MYKKPDASLPIDIPPRTRFYDESLCQSSVPHSSTYSQKNKSAAFFNSPKDLAEAEMREMIRRKMEERLTKPEANEESSLGNTNAPHSP